MAVEIPVVVDIEGAFQEAAKRVGPALKDIQNAVDKNQVDLFPEIEKSIVKLEKAKDTVGRLMAELRGTMTPKEASFFPMDTSKLERVVDALSRAQLTLNQSRFEPYIDGLTRANFELAQMNEYYRQLEIISAKQSDSINRYSQRLRELNEQWNAMTSKERNSAKGIATYEEARKLTIALQEQALTLDQMMAKENKRAELVKKGVRSRQYENAILNSTTKTMRVLHEQERILSERLSRATVGSEKYEKLKAQLQGVRAEIKKINEDINGGTAPAIEKTNSKLGMLIKNSLRLVALHTGSRFVRNIREVTAEFELQRVALGSIIQDTERANSLFREIKAAAIESPFEVKDLVSYTKQLSAYQIETDKLFDTTMKLADVSAGLGVDMGRLILAYGQVRAASVLRGQELRQFTEAGIPLVDKLAEKFSELNGRTVTTAEVFDLISKRAVPFRMIEEIFNDMTSAGGMFYKMQEKQAETLLGQWNNLKDAASIMYDEIGRTKTVNKAMTTLIKLARDMMSNWREIANVVKVAGTALVTYVAAVKLHAGWVKIATAAEVAATAAETTREAGLRRVITSLIGKEAAEKVATRATIIHTGAIKAADAASTLFGKTMWRLVAVMAKNPFGIAAIAVASLVGWLITLSKRTADVEGDVNKAAKSIQQMSKARETDNLVKRYEELSKKTNRTAKETAALRDISRELGKAFPQTTKAIDNQTGALKLNIDQLKNYSEEAQNAIKDSMRGLITANESQIKRFERRQEHIQKVLQRGYGFVDGSYYFGLSKDVKNAGVLNEKLLETSDGIRELTQANQDLQDSIDGVKRETSDNKEPYPPIDGGDRLKTLRDRISALTDAYKKFLELRKYLSDDEALRNIGLFFPSLGGLKPTYENTVAELEKMLSSYSGNADATRIIEQAIANIKFDKVKKDFDDAIKRISSDIKRSETARNFYNDILGLTGDNELAASLTMSVYGTEGEEFADRIKKQLVDSLSSVDANTFAGLSESIIKAFDEGDYKYLMDHLEEVPEKLRDTVKQVASDSEKYNADFLKDMYKTYEKTKDFEQRITDIRKREAANRKKILESIDIPESEKDKLLGASRAKEEQDVADVQVEALKSTDEWIRTFENLDKVGTGTLKNLISLIRTLIDTNGANMNAGTLRALTKSLESAETQVYQRNPFAGFAAGVRSYADAIGGAVRARKALKQEEDPEVQKALNESENQGREAIEKMKTSVDGLSSVFNNLNTIVSSVSEILNLDELSDGQAVLNGIATGLGVIGTALTFINGVLTLIGKDPIVLAISGAVAAAVALWSVISNLKVNKANRDIKEQDKLLEDLEYQYGRLQVAMEKSFGSDYITNYNQQLDNLAAKQAAYLKQAEAERSKGKKADEEKIKGYENSAREAADQIRDMQTQLAEFFSGTDLTSAAKDFANAWIEAYKEFGSVTDAMSEKFNDMIQEMVENSVAAQVMQQLLKPIFDEIDRRAREGGELSTEDIAAISKMATEQIPAINDAMTTLMNSLQAAGYDFRQQPGQFTGISRNIANATEESITGLAAGINTQNFYMSMINQNVAAILAVISGGAVPTEGAPSVQFNNELALQRLSGIDDKLATLLNQLDKVIKPMSVPAQYYVSVRQ